MYVASAAAILVSIFLFLLRALLGPTTHDRILAANALGSKTVILIALLGFIFDRPGFFDIALLYAMINFIGTIAIVKFIEYRRLS